MTVLIIPGLNDSGARHWQSIMEREQPDAYRVQQQDWANPSLDAWLQNLRASIAVRPHAILVAHSLGCSLVAHAVARQPDLPIGSVMLVAPADVESDCPDAALLRGFAPFPQVTFRFPALPLPARTIRTSVPIGQDVWQRYGRRNSSTSGAAAISTSRPVMGRGPSAVASLRRSSRKPTLPIKAAPETKTA